VSAEKPNALESWVAAAGAELGLAPSDERTALVLDLARDVAHGVLRPGAPVTAYLLGVAVGRGADPADAAGRLSAMALAWRPGSDEGPRSGRRPGSGENPTPRLDGDRSGLQAGGQGLEGGMPGLEGGEPDIGDPALPPNRDGSVADPPAP
jgi:hypothetical protein